MAKQRNTKSDFKFSPQEYRTILKEIQLDDIMLEQCTSKVNRERLDKSLEIKIDQKTNYEIQDSDFVTVNHSYTLVATPGFKRDSALKITCTFRLRYSSKTPLTEDFMDVFKVQNIPLNIWPYFREFVQNMTQRMNIPPLTLPLLKQ